MIVARLEHHGDHGDWHVHTMCGEIHDIPAGCQRHRNQGIRIPENRARYREREYSMGQQEAVNRAYSMFRIGKDAILEQGSLL